MSEQSLTNTVRVAIHALDLITRTGLSSYLQDDGRTFEVPLDEMEEADVVVVVVDVADVSVLEVLHSLSDRPDVRFVMVVGQQWQADISTAVNHGVRAVLWRDALTPAMFIRTLLTIMEGGGSFPPTLQGTLMEQVQWIQREVLAPQGLTASGVSSREADVLRLIAEGKEVTEIATKLAYSERTVRHVLSGLMKRLQLRNRAHAVSYAIRAGII